MDEKRIYSIKIGNTIYNCSSFKIIKINVPWIRIERVPRKKSNNWIKNFRNTILGDKIYKHNESKTINILILDIHRNKKYGIITSSINYREKETLLILSNTDKEYINKAFNVVAKASQKIYDTINKNDTSKYQTSKYEYDEHEENCIKFIDNMRTDFEKLYLAFECDWEYTFFSGYDEWSEVIYGSNPSKYGMEIFKYQKNPKNIITADLKFILEQIAKQDEEYTQKKKNLELEERKKRELEARKERERKLIKRIMIIERHKNIFNKVKENASFIETEFNSRHLLTKDSLSLENKLKEFIKVRDFCLEFLPQLKSKNFTYDEYIGNYSYLINEKDYQRFENDWISINKSIFALERGIKGEDLVEKMLNIMNDRLCFLRNYQLGCEHDFIVFCENGIFTMEVKNFSGDHIIKETGLMINKSNNMHEYNVAEQSIIHIETLRKNLIKCPDFNKNIPIREVICSADDRYTLESNFPEILVCYPTTIRNILFSKQFNKDNEYKLTVKEIKNIKKFLLENQEPHHTFDLFKPRGEISCRTEFINNFSMIVAAIQYIDKYKKQ